MHFGIYTYTLGFDAVCIITEPGCGRVSCERDMRHEIGELEGSFARLLNNYPLIRLSLLIPLWINAIHLVLPRFILRFARSVAGSKETRRNRRVESPSSFFIRSDTKSSLLVFDVFIVEYNVEDRKDARKREGRREREREETMENGRKEDEVREAERSSLGQACMVPRFASQWQVI